MQMDPEYLRGHYASLSDEALRAIDRTGLVEVARRCYDDELRRRSAAPHDLPDEEAGVEVEPPDLGDTPNWLEDAAEVYSWVVRPGNAVPYDAEVAQDALVDAGIPCHFDLFGDPPEQSVSPEPTHRWRLMVPGKLNLQASSILEREIHNPEFEAVWKTHLEGLSDHELRETNPQVTFCGLIDRIERVTRAYDEEIARRKLKPRS